MSSDPIPSDLRSFHDWESVSETEPAGEALPSDGFILFEEENRSPASTPEVSVDLFEPEGLGPRTSTPTSAFPDSTSFDIYPSGELTAPPSPDQPHRDLSPPETLPFTVFPEPLQVPAPVNDARARRAARKRKTKEERKADDVAKAAERARRLAAFPISPRIPKESLTSIDLWVKGVKETAKGNPVVFPALDFARASGKNPKRPAVPPAPEWITWEDNTPRMGLSNDGEVTIYYLPNLFPQPTVSRVTDDLLNYAGIVVPKQKAKIKVGKYREVDSQISGEVPVVRGWHAIGHWASAECVKPVGEFFQDGDGMKATCLITRKLAEVSAGINAVYNNLSSEDILIYEGCQSLYNCHTTQHTNRQDPPKSYAVMVSFGSFSGGYFHFRTLGLRARMELGDAIALRRQVVLHEDEQKVAKGYPFRTSCTPACGGACR